MAHKFLPHRTKQKLVPSLRTQFLREAQEIAERLGEWTIPIHLKNYEVFEHTADIGVRITGKDLKGLFINAGLAIFEISSQKQFTRSKAHSEISIKQKANNLEELFINWLNELLSLSSAKGLIFHRIKIKNIEVNSLEAVAVGSDIANYKVNTEIKAATFHQFKLKQNESGWVAEVILDV